MRFKTGIRIFLILAVWHYSSLPVFPQVLGTIKGHVLDKEASKPIAEAKVIIVSTRIQSIKYEMATDKNGFFYKSGLQPGVYQVSCEKSGFAPAVTNLRLTIGEERDITITLEIIRESARTAIGLMTQVETLLNEGKFQAVIDKITTASNSEPLNYVLYYYRAAALEKVGDQQKALADYQKALELKPDFSLVLTNIGKLYAKMGDYQKAIEYYKKAVEAGSTDVLALYNYGVCLINAANNTEAKTVLEKLLTIDPTYPDAHYQLGIICLGLGDVAKAKEYLSKFIELDPENSNVPVAKDILKSLN
jgi:tetratricopeptide (TPR) repeat protein